MMMAALVTFTVCLLFYSLGFVKASGDGTNTTQADTTTTTTPATSISTTVALSVYRLEFVDRIVIWIVVGEGFIIGVLLAIMLLRKCHDTRQERSWTPTHDLPVARSSVGDRREEPIYSEPWAFRKKTENPVFHEGSEVSTNGKIKSTVSLDTGPEEVMHLMIDIDNVMQLKLADVVTEDSIDL